MSKTLNNIASLVSNTPNYTNIKNKLDFNGFESKSALKANNKKTLKLLIPLSAVCAVAVVAVIVVPISLRNNSNNQISVEPVSDELLSFYLKNTSFGSADLPQGTSVGMLYNTYKQHPERMSEFTQRKEIFNLTAENKIHCYYVTKEVMDAVNQQFVPPSDFMLPWRGLTAYCYGYYNLPEDLKAQELMELEIDAESSIINAKINNYYLLDIVRFYSDSSIDDYHWIDFVDYKVKKNQTILYTNESKESISYCTCTFTNPNKLSEKERIYNYSYLCILDYHGFEIERDSNREVAIDTFAFDSRHADVDNDVTYYDDINACIISKELLSSSNNYGYLYQIYNVIFDFDKLVKLFGFLE